MSHHHFKARFCRRISGCLFAAFLVAFASHFAQAQKSSATNSRLTRFVDPFIGTGFHGHVFMGANVPFGAVQVGPANLSQGWDWCSGYHYSDSTIIGFAQTHLSGTGIGDLGDISIMPVTGDVKMVKGEAGKPSSGYYSSFSHEQETAKAGYYSVQLLRYGIKAELTATERVGFHQYTYPAGKAGKLVIDLKEGIGWDGVTESYIKQINPTTIAGYRYSKGWAEDQKIYFTMQFSRPIETLAVFDNTALKTGSELKAKRTKGLVTFSGNGGVVQVKVGISPVSMTNAAANIKAELPGWDFSKTVAAADAKWERELQKIRIKTKDEARLRTFYTAMYHSMIAPSVFNDHNGDYYGTDKKIYSKPGFTNYTTFSLWDTYRAAHPLMTVIHPEKVSDMVNTMLNIYKQQGKLPVWHLMGNETNCMVGNPAITVVADAYLKRFGGFDKKLAYEAMTKTAMLDERGLNFVKSKGYIPADSMPESVAKGMEYAIADWAISQVAKKDGKANDYAYWLKRGKNYVNYFEKGSGYMRGRINDNTWRSPFNPFESIHGKNDYTEGNAWQYLWLVPQDVEGLINLIGGEKRFIQKLDSLFIVQGDMGKEASPDISGLIGQYAHGNEPSHHITYMYAYAGQPWKTADQVRHVLDHLYTDKNDGLSGNEDVGQMSAWYIFSALGFYPANPANGLYVFGSPVVDEAEIQLGKGKTMKLRVLNNSKENKYIQSVKLNGRNYNKSYISHQDLVSGGILELTMGAKPSATWGVAAADRPYSELK
ncbi:GH92 family glycosyl hydrolase [Pedobacter sp. SYP-B3415]|uniref:GH92 family glycosyl hydrolase n=1 Tax=Pedobacter sp. SYP-B3415 TaxID=2496641 RepID=UPI00101D7C53|nr:GH92 family glycosyl hydrolase [Pedobacter sp. SYP-B3415]